jgi:hypothetical protein
VLNGDGSYLVGRKYSSVSPDPTSVPWLLLEAVQSSGTGVLGPVSEIQRVWTDGGLAPAGACALDGGTVGVPFTSHFFFYGP